MLALAVFTWKRFFPNAAAAPQVFAGGVGDGIPYGEDAVLAVPENRAAAEEGQDGGGERDHLINIPLH